jgi:hypothetical protein
MLFLIRPPFSIHLEKVNVVEQMGRKIRQPSVTSYYSTDTGTTVDLSESDAKKHLHKLEPKDAEARAFMQKFYDANEKVANARATSQPVGGSASSNAGNAELHERIARLEALVQRLTEFHDDAEDDEDAPGRPPAIPAKAATGGKGTGK